MRASNDFLKLSRSLSHGVTGGKEHKENKFVDLRVHCLCFETEIYTFPV